MKKRYLSLLIFIIILLGLFLLNWLRPNIDPNKKTLNRINGPKVEMPKDETLNPCLDFKDSNYLLKEMIKSPTNSFRYQNIHKKINNTVYRLRTFKKEGENTEFDQFIVYKEDLNEEEHIIEKSSYRPGKIYNQILNQKGENIYDEIGIEDHEGILFQYINGKLVKVDGQTDEEEIHCTISY